MSDKLKQELAEIAELTQEHAKAKTRGVHGIHALVKEFVRPELKAHLDAQAVNQKHVKAIVNGEHALPLALAPQEKHNA